MSDLYAGVLCFIYEGRETASWCTCDMSKWNWAELHLSAHSRPGIQIVVVEQTLSIAKAESDPWSKQAIEKAN